MPLSPMMQQYLTIKEANKDAILFFRLGDFYEMFFEDAQLASRELELTLTGRDCGLAERAPMCGVPYHAATGYIARLIAKGYKVAICEQMSDPSETKGLVERDVTRIITPGTVIDEGMLYNAAANYILAAAIQRGRCGFAFADVSTGEFTVYEFGNASARLADELARFQPREVLCSDPEQLRSCAPGYAHALSAAADGAFETAKAQKALLSHFSRQDLAAMDVDKEKLALCAAGALMRYLTDTQKNALSHITRIGRYESERHMALDRVATANLELVESQRTRTKHGSLLHVMDRTVTSMGSRQLRAWIEQPLTNPEDIERRLGAVSAMKQDQMRQEALRDALSPVYDVERLTSRIAYDTVNARDCLALCASLRAVPEVSRLLSGTEDPLIAELASELNPQHGLCELIERAIDRDAPVSVKEGGIIRAGYSEQLDRYRAASTEGKTWLASLEAQEREATGIKNLKVGYNRLFGYYIEVTKSFYELVPYRYARKQTLANCERFVTEELKEIEKSVLGAEDSAVRLEYELFSEIRDQLKSVVPQLQRTAYALKTLDCVLSLARLANENGYVRPTLNDEGRIDIKNGRHPVVEGSIGQQHFVPNDTHLSDEHRVMIITGPNMAGKSTYMRQVALIVLMAHMGSFVPAESADIALTDRIFTRIGASDDLYGGQSTFMVEMTELAAILKFATPKSLLILDEVGRGTSTFDGLSIAWAAVEHIAGPKCGARTLFATHYHELSELEGTLGGVVNYRITAIEKGDDVVFLRKIVPGGADRSFGVQVAGLAGLPGSLIARARQIMARLEVGSEIQGSIGKSILDGKKNGGNKQVELTAYQPMELALEIQRMDVMSMSPIDALNALYALSEKARLI